jgi:benzodiazapine receptor
MILSVIIVVAATLGVRGAGSALTEITPWYRSLRNPSWRPPGWAFGPIWTVIAVFTAGSALLAWNSATTEAERATTIGLFALNAVLNVARNLLFFKLRRPDWALIEVIALWLSILALMIAFYPRAPWAAALLLPYLLWVSIATVLNLVTVRLNRPFGGGTARGAAAPGARRTGGIVEGQK